MASEHVERERKFDVPLDFQLPDLPGVRRESHLLRASYYDTEDALLQARGVTLRRRVGGTDDGWHLKVPHPQGRLEIGSDVAPTRPPRELTGLVRGLRFDRPLHRRAVLRTRRDTYRLHTPDGALVAEIADDLVDATIVQTADLVQWREIEIELGPAGTADEMARLARLMKAAGARRSPHGSKYDHAVGEPAERPRLSGTAGLVDDYLQTQFQRITLGDLRMRRGENAVHKTRVAVRRTRSTLRVFARLFDPARGAEFDRELAWYAEVLGRVRDLDIIRHRVADDVNADTDGLIDHDAADRLLGLLDAQRQRAWEQAVKVLDSRRYGALLHELDEWQRDAPWTADPGVSIRSLLKKATKKSDKRLKRALSDKDAPDEAFHRARKAAKRTRYAAELARPALGKPAKRLATEHERRQDALGELQDHVLVVAALRDVAEGQTTTSRIGFVCGVLTVTHTRAKGEARSHRDRGA